MVNRFPSRFDDSNLLYLTAKYVFENFGWASDRLPPWLLACCQGTVVRRNLVLFLDVFLFEAYVTLYAFLTVACRGLVMPG